MKYHSDNRIKAHLQPLEAEARAERLARAARGGRQARRSGRFAAASAILVGVFRSAVRLTLGLLAFSFRPLRIAFLVGIILILGMLAIELVSVDTDADQRAPVVDMQAGDADVGPIPFCRVYDVRLCVD